VIRHLLKLVWARKRANALLIIEIFFSFVVVFAVVTLATTMIMRWSKPLGFDYQNVWDAHVRFPASSSEEDADDSPQRAVINAMVREMRSMPEVESVAAAGAPPYSNSTWTSGFKVNGRGIDVTRDTVTDGFATVLRMPLLRGRWFTADDETAKMPVVVIDSDVAMSLFGTLDVIGKTVSNGERDATSFRVVGVIAPFRKHGELSQDHENMVFDRLSLTQKQGRVARDIIFRVRPGTPADFEQTLIKRMHGIQPDYPVRVQHMDQMRDVMNKIFIAPAAVGGIVASFLIIMVALGLSGVLWQTVTRRTRELGLRRALGATGNQVNRQILLEVALLSTLALVVGVIVVAQLPLLGAFKIVSPPAFTLGFAGALATIYGLTLLCGLYPSWLAGKVQPAQALHYE
jgi:putative ABC transport system permease protein